MRHTGSSVSLDTQLLRERKRVKRTAVFLQHHPLSIPGGRKWEVMSQESDLGWQIHLCRGKKQILLYEMTSSLIAWDLSQAVLSTDWFTSQAAFSDSNSGSHLRSQIFKYPDSNISCPLELHGKNFSRLSSPVTLSLVNFYFYKSYLRKSSWCLDV